MDGIHYDWIAILIAAVLSSAIGYLWYSKYLFSDASRSPGDSHAKPHSLAPLFSFVSSLIMAFFLAFFEGYLGVTTVTDGVFIGFCIWLGFVAPTQIAAVIWLRQPLSLFFIHTGFRLLSLMVMGGILGA